jgi:ComF family protein
VPGTDALIASDPSAPPALLEQFLSLLFPSRCASCGEPRRGVGGGGICAPCWRDLPTLDAAETCPRCALPTGGGTCRGCERRPPPLERAAAVGPYAGSLKRLVAAYKFEGWDLLAPPAASLMAALARRTRLSEGVDAVAPIPSTRGRNRRRGYDPADLLAVETARRLGLPGKNLLERIRETVPQSDLPASKRAANVAGAFTARPAAAGQSILLVDDVVTTGATAFSAASALRGAGAREIRLLVLARTPEPGS